MNLKDWILKYLENKKRDLKNEINACLAIRKNPLFDAEEQNDRINMMVTDYRYSQYDYLGKLNIDFIQARCALMLDNIGAHMKEYEPGSITSNKCGESRQILNQIEKKLTAFMSRSFTSHMSSEAVTEIESIIALANTLDSRYCNAYDKV